MPPEILALIDKPFWLAAVLGVGALIGMTLEAAANELRRRAWRKRNPGRWTNNRPWRNANGNGTTTTTTTNTNPFNTAAPPPAPYDAKRPDAADQLRIVMAAQFEAQPLLNKSEARVFRELDRIVLACNPGWQVMAQVSLGEILRGHDPVAHSCINSKRVDLLLVDEHCHPRHAIEYQGSGHYQSSAAARDAVKKEALRRAGITYHEVVAGQTTPVELRRLVERLLVGEKVGAV